MTICTKHTTAFCWCCCTVFGELWPIWAAQPNTINSWQFLACTIAKWWSFWTMDSSSRNRITFNFDWTYLYCCLGNRLRMRVYCPPKYSVIWQLEVKQVATATTTIAIRWWKRNQNNTPIHNDTDITYNRPRTNKENNKEKYVKTARE